MWTSARNERAAAWLDIGQQHQGMTERTVREVRALVTAGRRRQRQDGTLPEVPLSEVADLIVRAAQATVRAGLRGQMDAQARDAAQRVNDLGSALGIEIAPQHQTVIDGIDKRPPPPQGATHQLHREIIDADPALTAFFATVEEWGQLSAQLVGGGIEAAPNLDGSIPRYAGDDGTLAHPPARGRWGAVRAWRQQGAALLIACQPRHQ
jgi:hypothetical protein